MRNTRSSRFGQHRAPAGVYANLRRSAVHAYRRMGKEAHENTWGRRADILVPVLALLNFCLLAAGCAYLYSLTLDLSARIRPGASLGLHEIESAAKYESDYAEWRQQFNVLQGSMTITSAEPRPALAEEETWEAREFVIPDVRAARAALEHKLPRGVEIEEMYPVEVRRLAWRASEATYQARLVFNKDFVMLPIKRVQLDAGQYGEYAAHGFMLVASRDLPPGYYYSTEKAERLVQAEQEVLFNWKVRLARIVDGDWQIQDSESIVFGSNPDFEMRYFDENRNRPGGPIRVVRAADKADVLGNEGSRALIALNKRINAITEAVGMHQQDVWSKVDGDPAWRPTRFGGARQEPVCLSPVNVPLPEPPRQQLVERVVEGGGFFGFGDRVIREYVTPPEEVERYEREMAGRQDKAKEIVAQRKVAANRVAKFDQFLKEELTREMMTLASERKKRITQDLPEPTRFVRVNPSISPFEKSKQEALRIAVARMNGKVLPDQQTRQRRMASRQEEAVSPFSGDAATKPQPENQRAESDPTASQEWAPPLPGSEEAVKYKKRWTAEFVKRRKEEEKQEKLAAENAPLDHEGAADEVEEPDEQELQAAANFNEARNLQNVIANERRRQNRVSNSAPQQQAAPPQRYIPSNVYRAPRYTDP